MSKKVLFTALAALGLSSAALASVATTSTTATDSGIYLGVQAGYGDTNWNDIKGSNDAGFANVSTSVKDTGFAGRLFAGYDFNQYLAVEGGYTYFPNSDITNTFQTSAINFGGIVVPASTETDKYTIKTYGLDLVGRINVPVYQNFGLYAKAGPGYLHTSGFGGNVGNVDLVYGFGADYKITDHLIADASFTRFNGDHQLNSSSYQPNADLYALGLAYKFNV